MFCENLIREIAPDCSVWHVETLLRHWHGTLNHLSREQFETDVHRACQVIERHGKMAVATLI